MKTTIQSKVILIIMLFAGIQAQAHDFEVNGIYYGISIFNKNTAYVTHQGTGYNDYKEYSGSVVIPGTVTYNGKSYTVASIGGYAFYGCDGLTSVTIPSTVTAINQNAFNSCSGLEFIECKAITPPTLGDNAFTSYTATLKVPESSKTAYKSADVWKYFKYYGEEGGNDDIPTDNSGLNYNIISPNEVEVIAGIEKYSGDIVIPSETTIDGKTYTVIKIGDESFSNCNGLTSVTIPNTITTIGVWAFDGSIGLTNIVIPEGVTSIGSSAFSGCIGLTYITIPNSVTRIEFGVFYGCTSLKNVMIGKSVTSIGNNAFFGCTGLTSVEIGSSVSSIGYSAFSGCTSLASVTIPNTVTNIEKLAFSGCTGLTNVTSLNPIPPICGTNVFDGVNTQNIPLTVPSESVSAYKSADTWKDFKFEDETQETSVLKYNIISDTEVELIASETKYTGDIVIPSEVTIEGKEYSVTTIRNYAFYDCNGLTSITIPNSVTIIGDYAFCDCDGLTSITIPNSVTSIGYKSFGSCDGLTSVTIGNSLTEIWASSFYSCTSLTYVIIGSSVTNIKTRAFERCSALTSITIPISVTNIENAAFMDCTGLTSVTSLNPTPPTCVGSVFAQVDTQSIPLSVPAESVELYKAADTWKDFGTITGISGGQEINIGDVVEYEGLTYKVISDTEVEVIAGESKYTGDVIIPSQIAIDGRTYIVTTIGENAFYDCSDLTSVKIPVSVISIGSSAFQLCTGLINVTIGNSVTSIGYSAFCGCTDLKAVYITDLEAWCKIGFGSYDANPLYYAKNLYKNNEKVTNLVIPNTITAIKFATFYNCSSLTSVTIPNTVTSIGDSAFQGCIGLINIEIPNSVTSIGDEVFCDCAGLTSVTIGNSVASIGNSSFYNCTSITSVYITDVEAWCKIDFGYYSNPISGANSLYLNNVKLTNIEIPNTITEIKDYAFVGYDGLASITIPNTVTSIGESAFQGCSSLTSVIIPNSVISIGESAFYYCSGLTSITIGNSVASIGKRVFYDCTELSIVTSLNTIPPVCKTNVFGNVNTQNISLSVPSESVSAYRSADTWKDFGTITGIGGQGANIGDIVENEGLTYKIISETEVEVIAGESKYTGSIVIPSEVTIDGKKYKVTRIGWEAFYGCTDLISVTIPNSVTSIGDLAFYYCTNLTSITIPNSVIYIGGAAFYGCTGLISIKIPNTVTSIYTSTFDNTGWYNNQPDGILYLDKYCLGYKGNEPTGALTLKDDTRLIAGDAFYGCDGLTNVTIPESVTSIGGAAFAYCYGLTSVTSLNPTPPTCETGVFGNVNTQNIPLTVPSESVELYQVADTWKDFGTITGIGGTELPTEPTLEEQWCHDISAHGSAVRRAVCIEDQIAVTDVNYSSAINGSGKVLFYNTTGKMDKSYDVAKFLSNNQVGTTGEDGAFTPYTLGCGIAVDDVGNIVVNLGFPSAISSTNFVAIKPNGEMEHIECDVSYMGGESARADFIDVTGNVFSNAYIGLALHSSITQGQNDYVAVYNIFDGGFDHDYSNLVSTGDVYFSTDTKVFWANKTLSDDAEYAPEFYVHHRSSAMYYCDGYSDIVKMEGDNYQIGKATCTGATAFEVNGTTYIVMPTPDSSGMRANAFKIINVETSEVVVTSQGAVGYTDKTNYAQDYSAWVNEDGTVNIAQLVQGTYLAMYKFYPGKDTSISIGANMNMSVAEETLIDDEEEPIEYYNLNGVRVQNPDRGVYIKRQGGRATKVVL